MGLKTEEREINGLVVTTTELPAMRALKLLTRLGKVFGPMLAGLPDLKSGQLGNLAVATALGTALGRLEEADVSSLTRDILASTRVRVEHEKGPRVVELTSESSINTVFEGRLNDLLLTLAFALEVNFAAFFLGLRRDDAPQAGAPPATGEGA
jgi:hypothetical protein